MKIRHLLLFFIMIFVNVSVAQTKTYRVVLGNPCSGITNQEDTIQAHIDSINVFTCDIDSVKLKVENLQYGNLQWEQSYDGVNWISIFNEVDTVLVFKPSITSYYRVVNKLPYCQPIISSKILINKIPLANAGSDRIINNNNVLLTGNRVKGSLSKWTIIEGAGGNLQNPDSASTTFSGIPASNNENGSTGIYKLMYSLKNECGETFDTITIRLILNQFYEKIIVVDATDSIMSTQSQHENGEYIILFSDTTLNIIPQTILIGITGDGFMRKVETVRKDNNTYIMTTSQAKIEDIIIKGGLEIGQLYNLESINQSLKVKGYNKLNKMPTRQELNTDEKFRNGSHFFIISNDVESALNGVSISKQNAQKVNSSAVSSPFSDFYISYNFDGTKLFDKNGIKGTLDGNITFKPNIVSDVNVDLNGAKAFIGVDNSTLSIKSKLTLEAATSSSWQSDDITVGTMHNKILLTIGFVPILIQFKTQINFNVKIAAEGNLTNVTEYEKTYKVNAGINYNDGAITNYFSESEASKLTNNLKVKGSITGSLDIGPKIYVTINGLAGPYVDLKMTSDLTLCASTENLQDFNWQADAYLGAKLTLGLHSYMFKKELFDVNKTWENRKLFNEKYPYMLEYISGNNQQYTVGNPLLVPLRIRMLTIYGVPACNVLVTFEAIDNCGIISQKQILTDANGYAETIFTPTLSRSCKIQVFAKDCDFNYLKNAPFTFLVTEKTTGIDCSKSTLSASIKKLGSKLVLFGYMGVPPYTYSTDLSTYSTERPQKVPVSGQNYSWSVKDSNGCIAYANYKEDTVTCKNSDLNLDVELLGNNVQLIAKGGFEPYSYSLDRTSYTSTPSFRNLTIGDHIVTLKDANGCEVCRKINISNSTQYILPYFDVVSTVSCYAPVYFSNLSANANSYLWDFGDNKTSTLENPIHIYTTVGKYKVTLTIFNGSNQKTFTKTITVNATNPNIFNPYKATLVYFVDNERNYSHKSQIYLDENGISTNEFNIDISDIPNGGHTLYIQAIDANGKSSFIQRQSFWKDVVSINQTPNLKRIEYFFDTDPGIGKGSSIPFTAGKSADLAYTIDLSGVSNGGHTLYVRSIDQNGKSGFIQRQSFWKDAVSINQTPNLKQIEYFFDTDPGIGKGSAIPFTTGKSVDLAYTIDLTGVNNGGHTLYVRSIDQNGKSGFIQRQSFWKDAVSVNQTPNLKRIEYFFDTDPGIGKGSAIPFTAGKSVDLAYTIDLTGVNNGGHTLYVRSIDQNGKSSFIQRQSFWKDAVSINQTPNLKRIEYFFDTDPGINKGNAIPFTADRLVDLAYTVDLTGVSNGGHTLYVRSVDQNGKSSFIQRQSFWKTQGSASNPDIVKIEYFVDREPDAKSIFISKQNQAPFIDTEFDVDLTGLTGKHLVYVRAKDSNGHWSFMQVQEVCAGMNVDFTTDKNAYKPNESVLFNINNKTSNTYTYAWDFINSNNYVAATGLTANYKFTQDGTYQVNLKVTSSDGCSSIVSKSVTVSIFTDNGNLLRTDFKADIYPNPTSGKFRIQMNKPVEKLKMQVYTVDGKLIYTSEKSNTTTVVDEDFTSYIEGLYFIRLTDNKNVIVKRLIIKK